MRKSMCITYIVEDKLYVNITNKCSNRCEFCIRNNGDGAYGSDSLWLLREPTREEILESIFSHDLTKFPELVFCGYGEPTQRLDVLLQVAGYVRKEHPSVKIRINTNGLAGNTFPNDLGYLQHNHGGPHRNKHGLDGVILLAHHNGGHIYDRTKSVHILSVFLPMVRQRPPPFQV